MARLGILSGAHLYVDMLLAFLPPLLPILMEDMGLSLFMAGILVSTMTVANGMTQPIFGHWADRIGRPWWFGASLIVIGIGAGLFGTGGSYGTLLVLAALIGICGAAFHPMGMVMVPRALGGRPGAAMSIWSLGGTVGGAAAPIVTLGLVGKMDLGGLMWLAVPGLLLAAAAAGVGVSRLMPESRRQPPAPMNAGDAGMHRRHEKESFKAPTIGKNPEGAKTAPDDGPSSSHKDSAVTTDPVAEIRTRNRWLSLLAVAAVARATALVGMNAFIPVYYTRMGFTTAVAGNMLVLYLLAGSAGSVAGALLADAIGRKPVTVWSQIIGALSVAAFALTDGWTATMFLLLAAMALYATFSVVIIYGQELMPHRPAMASGFLGGFAWGIGSLALGPLGALADTYGLGLALQLMAAVALLGLPMLLPLPETWIPRRQPAPAR